jgi:hypothetical protein
MRVAVRCRLPGPLRQGHDAALPALLPSRKHRTARARRFARVVVRIKFPALRSRAHPWNRRRAVEIGGPWQARPRVAVLSPWFRVNGGARVFFEASPHALRRYKPGALAGPVDELRRLAERVLTGEIDLPSLEFGVLAFTGPGRARLADSDRELFWRAFEVPVFEQRRGPHGDLLAYECEAHSGLHLVREAAAADWTGVEVVREPCPCGVPTPRAVPARPARTQAAAAR